MDPEFTKQIKIAMVARGEKFQSLVIRLLEEWMHGPSAEPGTLAYVAQQAGFSIKVIEQMQALRKDVPAYEALLLLLDRLTASVVETNVAQEAQRTMADADRVLRDAQEQTGPQSKPGRRRKRGPALA